MWRCRRIQIDREQWEKMLATVKRTVVFWKGVPRPVEADESLAALLSRRDQVRAKQTAPTVEARPELFQPSQPVILPPRPTTVEPAPPKVEVRGPEQTPASGEQQPASTTSRLLEAKRKAQRKSE
jgi:hypothetical protein